MDAPTRMRAERVHPDYPEASQSSLDVLRMREYRKRKKALEEAEMKARLAVTDAETARKCEYFSVNSARAIKGWGLAC
eukprot:6214740-Pleurochrysis_carterae.AAC.9